MMNCNPPLFFNQMDMLLVHFTTIGVFIAQAEKFGTSGEGRNSKGFQGLIHITRALLLNSWQFKINGIWDTQTSKFLLNTVTIECGKT